MDSILNQLSVNCTKGSHVGTGMRSAANQTGKTSPLNPYTHHIPEGSAGHQQILDSHANSGVNALIYVGVVLLLYIIFMSFIVVRYVLMKSHCKTQNPTTPYYFGGGGARHFRAVGGTTTTTGTTTLGGASVSGYAAGGATSVFIEGDETPPEIRFIETEL